MRRYAMVLVVVAASVTLVVSKVPASVSAATVGSAGSAVHHAKHGEGQSLTQGVPFRISADGKLLRGSPKGHRVVVGDAICLKNSTTYCAAMDSTSWEHVIIGAIEAIADLIEIFTNKESGGSDEEKKDGNEDGGSSEGNGDCLGVTGYNQDVTLMSCSSPHGVWWQWDSYNGGYRIWNTYAKGDLIAPATTTGDRLFVHAPEDWSTWITEFCDGC